MFRRTVFRTTLIVTLLGLLLLTGLPSYVQASPPIDDLVSGATEPSGIVGASSTAIDCLATADSDESAAGACPSVGSVELNWRGQPDSARLGFSLPDPDALPQGPLTLRVNGHAVSVTPGCAPEHPCLPGEYLKFKLPVEAVVQGTNQIELVPGEGTESGQALIAYVRLQVRGDVIPVRADESAVAAGEIGASAVPFPITFVNSLDGTTQEAIVQEPNSYNPSIPTPLLVYAHGRSGTMEAGPDQFGAAVNTRGWLLISPEMHGHWDVPAECYSVPNDCTYDDQILAGTTPSGAEAKPGAYAHASLESQYDVVGAVKYMVDHYNVKPDQIYLIGGSMGGQTTNVTAAKFPHIFAAAYTWMGISDLGQWYGGLEWDTWKLTLAKECHDDGDPQTPSQDAFCYQRRSGVEFARNYIHIPISMTHNVADELVPIIHSYNLASAINAFGPDYPASVNVEPESQVGCGAPYHCLEPDKEAVLDYLEGFRLNNNPEAIRIASDESKLYYWMNLLQDATAAPHWSYVDVTRDPDSPTVEVTTNDTATIRIWLNLGTSTRTGEVMPQPGMGLPSTTYLRAGAGYYNLVDYTSGYLATRVTATGQPRTFTLSALDVDVTADPAEVPDDQSYVSTITIQVRDSSDQARPVPNGTPVQLHTTKGTFANGQRNITRTTVDGQATTTLTINPEDDEALITATVRLATGTATVNVVRPEIGLVMTPASQTVYAHTPFTMNYRVTNEGDTTLTGVAVTTDDGGSGSTTVCTVPSLAPGASTTCPRPTTLSSSATIHGQVTGQTSLGDSVSASDSAQITTINPSMGLSSIPNPLILYEGQTGSLTYHVSNTGDTVLTSITIQDDGGSGGSFTICTVPTLQPGATATCPRDVDLAQLTTISGTASGQDLLYNPVNAGRTSQIQAIAPSIGNIVVIVATATGTDPLDNPTTVQTFATVIVGGRAYLPYVVNGN